MFSQKRKPTDTALNTIVSCIEDNVIIHEFTLVAFLNIDGTFNNINYRYLISI